MDPPGPSAQARLVLEHILEFQDDPDLVHLLGGDFGLEPEQLQVRLNGTLVDPAQVALRSGCRLAVARSAWAASPAPGGFTLVEVRKGSQKAMKLQRGGPATQASVGALLERPAEDARGAALQALVRRAFPPAAATAAEVDEPSAAAVAEAMDLDGGGEPGQDREGGAAATALAGLDPERAADLEDAAIAQDETEDDGDLESGEEAEDGATAADGTAAASAPAQRPRRTRLSRVAENGLTYWFREHVAKPYPTQHQKAQLMSALNVTSQQLTNWFSNTRKRYWFKHPHDPSKNLLLGERLPGSQSQPRRAKSERPPEPKPRLPFSEDAKRLLSAWARNHLEDPYPTDAEKWALAAEAKVTWDQVGHWFINYRGRGWRRDKAAVALRRLASDLQAGPSSLAAQPVVHLAQPGPAEPPAAARATPASGRQASSGPLQPVAAEAVTAGPQPAAAEEDDAGAEPPTKKQRCKP
jgi:hypothetical protein